MYKGERRSLHCYFSRLADRTSLFKKLFSFKALFTAK